MLSLFFQLYLQQYGYLGATRMNSSSLVDGRVFNRAILEFQSFAGLPATGWLNIPIFMHLVVAVAIRKIPMHCKISNAALTFSLELGLSSENLKNN